MKLLKSQILENTQNIGRFVHVKINEGIETILQKDSENDKKSAKQRLNDGKKVAMNALPSWAQDMSDEVSKHAGAYHEKGKIRGIFEYMKGNESVKQVEELVKPRIFDVIKYDLEGPNPSLSPRLHGLMNDIDKNQSITENTIGDVDQAIGTVGKLSDALKSQLDRIQKYQKADNQRNHFWQRMRRKQSDLEIFTQRRSVIEGALAKLNTNLTERKAETEKDINESAKTAREEFDDLSPEDQASFRIQMNAEITNNRDYHKEHIRSSDLEPKFILGVMSNQPTHRRLEIYKLAQLDETKKNRDLLLATSEFQGESAKFHQANEAFISDRDNINELDDLKINFSAGIEQSEIKPHNDLKGLTKDLETFFRGENADIKTAIWKDYPENFELTDLQKITSFLVELGDGTSGSGKKLNKSLRIKLLGYLEYINTDENGEELGKHSIEFVKAEKDAKSLLDTSQTAFKDLNLNKDLSNIYEKGKMKPAVLKHLNDESYEIFTQADELRDVAKKLNGEEKILLDGYIKTLDDAAKAIVEIREIWQNEIDTFRDEENAYDKKEIELKTAKAVAKNKTTKTKSFIARSKHGIITHDSHAEAVTKLSEITTALDAHLLIGKTTSKSAKFTLFNAKFDKEFKNIDKDFKSINKTSRTPKNGKINDNIKDFLERQSNNDVHEKSKAEFQRLQERMLSTLAKKGLGSQVVLRGQDYNSGNPPSLANLAENSDKVPDDVTATVWAKSENLVILRTTTHVIVVQKSTETGNVEMIGFEVSSSMTDKDSVIDEFRKKQAENKSDYISAPTSITPLI